MKILMCRPTYFDVEYEINAWMDKGNPVDKALAQRQWDGLYETYISLGYEVEFIEPVEGLPDMVFTANGGLVRDKKVVLPTFKHKERQPETNQFKTWFENYFSDSQILAPDSYFEGEGDALFVGDKLFGGYGFRSNREEYQQIGDFLDVEVVPLELIDPRFYHFDTCFSVLDAQTVAYYPGAFSEEARESIKKYVPNVIEASEQTAKVFGLNMFSDGKNTVVAVQAEAFRNELENRGYNVIPVDVSEFRKSGGGIKCMTLLLEQYSA